MRNFFVTLTGGMLVVCSVMAVSATPQQQQQNAVQSGSAASSGQDQSLVGANEALSPESQDKLIREVRHELIMLPYYGVFDNLVFSLNGRNVTLSGQVTTASLKNDAANVVKHIEGVENVTNNIEVLPPSSMDDRIRRQVYNSIYSYGPLFKYGNMSVPPIHIIVRNGRITLDGVVDTEGDKNLAGMRANQVPGTFGVTNNLRVVNPSSRETKKK
jgi:hyperosmotically inducible protein